MSKNNEIKIKQDSSSLSEFVKRPLASDEEAVAFEQYIENEAREEEIKNSLTKIYQDDQGNRVDVKKMIIKPKRGWLFNLVTFIILLFVFGGAIYGAYNYIYLKIINSKLSATLEFEANKEVAVGQEFYYNLNYKNEDNISLNRIEITVKYPDNFIFLDSSPKPNQNNNFWEVGGLDPRRSDVIRIKGKLAGPADSGHIILADMLYRPKNFSSEFKKSASFETKISHIGLDFSFSNSSNALVDEINEIVVKFKAKNESYIHNLRLTVEHPPEAEIINAELAAQTDAQTGLKIEPSGPDAYLLSNFGKNDNEFKIKFKIKEKKQPNLNFKLKFELAGENLPAKYYLIHEKSLTIEAIKSDLNMNLIINGSPFNQGVNFGQTLNYLISYANKGESVMKDVIIMAVLESDFLDWQTLNSHDNGKINGNTISWSKQEIPTLAELASGAEAIIDFSLKLKTMAQIDLSKSYQVKSYVRYSLEGKNITLDNQSNTIINKINSDLNLKEEVRYFNDDNIAVGFGPWPPKVGQTTGLKVYWTINNNLHELNDLLIKITLPANVSWDGKNRSSAGLISYDGQANQVVWQIGHLPAMTYQAGAEFNVNIRPAETDRNKLMIILPGANITAIDGETKMQINKTLKAKTTKLEDDNMVGGDGIVQ